MGVLNENVLIGASGLREYLIDNSVRLNDNDTAHFTRTPGVTGNRKTWSWYGWVKRANLGTSQAIFSAGNSTSNETVLMFNSSNELEFFGRTGGTSLDGRKRSNMLFRDVGTAYHIGVVVDTTNATAADRIKLYVNGEQISTKDEINYPLNHDTMVNNSGTIHYVGQRGSSSSPFDGYFSEDVLIDGAAIGPENVGEFDEVYTSWWKPKLPDIPAWGTNGSWLDFEDSGNLGADVSGNGNNWTPVNLAATDQMIDTPTNNHCIISPLDSTINNLSEGNLRLSTATSGSRSACGSFLMSTGKWYWEAESIGGAENFIGLIDADYTGVSSTLAYQFTSGSVFYHRSGNKYVDNASSAYGASYTTNDVIGVALDLDAGTVTFYKNNVSQGAITLPATGSGAWKIAFSSGTGAANQIYFADFGQAGFTYTPPAGFVSLTANNLPSVDIVPDENFNTKLYTGNASAGHSITGVGFPVDLTWGKSRSNAFSNELYDIVRGATGRLLSNSTTSESPTSGVTSFDSDGYTLGADGGLNTNGATYVSWNWKMGGAPVSNTDGSITSQVSANVAAGQSIVSFVGTGNAETVGHGLPETLEAMIVKNRDGIFNWAVYHKDFASDSNWMRLNTTDAVLTSTSIFNSTRPTSSVFSVGNGTTTCELGSDIIAYCFHSVPGYSKIGKYTGNGSSDGPFIALDFLAKFWMVKRVDVAESWSILDGERDPFNPVEATLYANNSNAELDEPTVARDYLSNGIKIRGTWGGINASGGEYIFIALSENPFKHTNAR